MDRASFYYSMQCAISPQFLSDRLQTLAQWTLGIEIDCNDFLKDTDSLPDWIRIFVTPKNGISVEWGIAI